MVTVSQSAFAIASALTGELIASQAFMALPPEAHNLFKEFGSVISGSSRLNDERRTENGAPLPDSMGRKLIRDNAADAFARTHEVEPIVDIV